MSIEPIIAVNRFGLGAAPGELAAAAADPRSWLTKQIKDDAPPIPEFGTLASSGEGLKAYPRWIASLGTGTQRHERRAAASRTVEGTFREQLGPIMQQEVSARLAAAASTPAPFRERLVWFWSNHFTVSAEKALVFALVGSFEREAIRPHVGGHFADMLLAASRHPAMILYLDNHLSVRKGWQGARAAREPKHCVSSTQGPEREPRARDPGAAYAGRERRLHAGGRHRVRTRAHGLDRPPDDVRPR